MGTSFSIGKLANQTDVNIDTIRFYERRGLLPDPERRASGYRIYNADTIDRLRFIVNGKELGFSLAEISDLLTLKVDPDTSCADVKLRADAKISSVREKIESLQNIEKALTKLSNECHGAGPQGDCPIIDALEVVGEA